MVIAGGLGHGGRRASARSYADLEFLFAGCVQGADDHRPRAASQCHVGVGEALRIGHRKWRVDDDVFVGLEAYAEVVDGKPRAAGDAQAYGIGQELSDHAAKVAAREPLYRSGQFRIARNHGDVERVFQFAPQLILNFEINRSFEENVMRGAGERDFPVGIGFLRAGTGYGRARAGNRNLQILDWFACRASADDQRDVEGSVLENVLIVAFVLGKPFQTGCVAVHVERDELVIRDGCLDLGGIGYGRYRERFRDAGEIREGDRRVEDDSRGIAAEADRLLKDLPQIRPPHPHGERLLEGVADLRQLTIAAVDFKRRPECARRCNNFNAGWRSGKVQLTEQVDARGIDLRDGAAPAECEIHTLAARTGLYVHGRVPEREEGFVLVDSAAPPCRAGGRGPASASAGRAFVAGIALVKSRS